MKKNIILLAAVLSLGLGSAVLAGSACCSAKKTTCACGYEKGSDACKKACTKETTKEATTEKTAENAD